MKMGHFTNPYNFVPLEGTCSRSKFTLQKENCYTGFFECELELLTPLIVPNTSCPQALCSDEEIKKGYQGYEFCSYEDLSGHPVRDDNGYTLQPKEPVIPGSAIRGPVRSVYEAAFQGCMSTVRTDMELGRRNPKAKKPGILEKNKDGDWILTPCSRAMLNVSYSTDQKEGRSYEEWGKPLSGEEYRDLQEGQEIWIKLSKNGYKNRKFSDKLVADYRLSDDGNAESDDFIKGWLHKGEPLDTKKHHESVFYLDANAEKMQVPAEEFEILEKVKEEYQHKKKDGKEEYDKTNSYKEYSLKGDRILVYYVKEKNTPFYLSPACIGKELYRKKLGTILEKNGGYQPCTDVDALCPACKLFGMVSREGGKNETVGARVRFTDALLSRESEDRETEPYYMQPLVLPAAGTPRPSAVEFYTESPYGKKREGGWKEEGYWTYDYLCIKKKNNYVIREPLSDGLPRIRGRKFYWHNDNWKDFMDLKKFKDLKDFKSNCLDHVMKQRVRPLYHETKEKKKRRFSFRVYFDRLNQEELEQLRWSLDFADESCAHKIGRGKPLGFGSAKIHIIGLKMQKLDLTTGKIELVDKEYDERGQRIAPESEAVRTLKLMANNQEYPKDVSYPKIEGKKESFHWFANNMRGKESKNMQPAFSKVLPKAVEEIGEQRNDSRRLKS